MCEQLTADELERRRMVRETFKTQLQNGFRPRIEFFLHDLSPLLRGVLLRELLALELHHQGLCGEVSDLKDWLLRFPTETEVVKQVHEQFGRSTPVLAVTPPNWPAIPNYCLKQQLGEGGMATVFRGTQVLLGREDAIKVLRPNALSADVADGFFEEETRAVGRLLHPNIVRAYSAGTIHGKRYLVLELVDGLDFERIVNYCGPLPVADACEIIRQAAVGLQHAHSCGIVHRDLKPSNLMLGWTSRPEYQVSVKVTDFGLAQLRGRQSQLNLSAGGCVLGTLDYMAPEQFVSPAAVDIRSDIYGLGCTMYSLLVGKPPFAESAPGVRGKMLVHRDALPESLLLARPDASLALEEVIFAMLAKDPADRFQSPADLAFSLMHFNQGHDLPQLLELAEDCLGSALQPLGSRSASTLVQRPRLRT